MLPVSMLSPPLSARLLGSDKRWLTFGLRLPPLPPMPSSKSIPSSSPVGCFRSSCFCSCYSSMLFARSIARGSIVLCCCATNLFCMRALSCLSLSSLSRSFSFSFSFLPKPKKPKMPPLSLSLLSFLSLPLEVSAAFFSSSCYLDWLDWLLFLKAPAFVAGPVTLAPLCLCASPCPPPGGT